MDQMTPKERMAVIRSGGLPDRMPIRLMFNSAAGVLCGMTCREMFSSAENYAACQLAAYRRYGCDGVNVSYSMNGIGAALGAVVSRPEHGTFFIREHPVKKPEDIAGLELEKIELSHNELAKQAYDAAQILLDSVGEQVGVGISFPGPASGVVSLVGMENYLRWGIKYPKAVKQMLEFCTEAVKILSAPFIELGVGVGLSDPAASGMILGEKRYCREVQPYTKEIFSFFSSRGQKALPYHVCGDTTNILPAMVQAGATSLSIDNRVSLAAAKEMVGDQVALSGNIDPVDVIMNGTAEEIDEAVKAAYLACWDSPKGFTISPGCGIPVNTSIEQIDLFVKSAKKYAVQFRKGKDRD